MMNQMIHDWDDERAAKILTNCRKGIRAGEPARPGQAEWRDLFAASGFRHPRHNAPRKARQF